MTLYVSVPSEPAKLFKRGILANLTKFYDLLGLVSPSVLEGKQVCGEASDMKLSWDIPLPTGIAKRWLRRDKNAPNDVYFPRSLVQYHEPINNIKLHAFGDANSHGVCAVAHAVVTQALGVTQGLIAAKSCLNCQEKSDSSFGARVRPYGSQLFNKYVGCTRRPKYDGGYTVLARQHFNLTLTEQ